MELDKRISKDLRDVYTLYCRNNNNLLGIEVYASNDIDNFNNIDACRKGKVDFIDAVHGYAVKIDSVNTCYFNFVIPASAVKPKEKQYRPFTLNEFLHVYELGDIVTLRCKYNDRRYAGIVTGYEAEKDEEKAIIHIGCYSYLLSVLFTDYERINSEEGEWVPFGVEVEE